MRNLLMTVSLLCLGTILCAQPTSIDIEDKRLKGLDKELNQMLKDYHVAGFSVAVVEADKIVYAQGFGYRDVDQKLPVDANTLFAIGSCTKAFTASLLGKLEADDKVDFDERPAEYLPELRFYDDDMNRLITVRDLMCHRTGLPRHDFSWYMFPTPSESELLARIEYQAPSAPVRATWQYNNFMFLVQGAIAGKLYRQSWAEAIRNKLFTPLGMMRSNTSIAELEGDENASLGYEVGKGDNITRTDYYAIRGMRAAGAINSSANEMANWTRMWIQGGLWQDSTILPSAYVQDAISAQMVVGNGLPNPKHTDMQFMNYGYGWFMASYRGHYRVEHGGNIDGFSASTSFFPNDSIGIVVLVNQDGSAVPTLVRRIIADRMLELPRIDWDAELKEIMKPGEDDGEAMGTGSGLTDSVPSAHAWEDFTGSYHHPGYGTFKVSVSGDSLFVAATDKKFWLRHRTYDAFTPVEVAPDMLNRNQQLLNMFTFTFQTDGNGEITGVMLPIEQSLEELILFERQLEVEETSEEALGKYVGEYQLPGVIAKFYTKDDATLYAFLPGQPEYELLKTGEHAFTIKTLDGYKAVFEVSESGDVTAVRFVQPNGVFRAERK